MKIDMKNSFPLDIISGLLMSVAAGVMVSMILSVLVLMLPSEVHADVVGAEVEQVLMKKSEVNTGRVLFRTDKPGLYSPAPILKTDVHMRVNGMIVRTKVVQRFKNPSHDWVEAVYVFPLPEKAAVDHLRMRIGERIIEGKIKEKQEAKKIYQKAKREGKKASLIEQERPNMFTNSIANIGPGETISVEIEYQQSLRFDRDKFRLRFPLVVAPRYIPGKPIAANEEVKTFSGTGWAADTDQVVDASRITPPVTHPNEEKINPVSIRVELNAGFPMVNVNSSYHAVNKKMISPERVELTLKDKYVPADRDFELVWQPDRGYVPRAALFTERKGKDNYMMMMVMPPDSHQANQQVMNREVIYVIDTSSSMSGTSIKQARRALRLAVEQLKPGDYFNIIQFNSYTSLLFEKAVPADQVNLDKALRYVDALRAINGTEMASALHAALGHEDETGLVRQVVFLTDGSIGNEDALFKIINQKLGNSRLFTVGIGSAPNSHFMSKAAQFGRGTYTYIGDLSEVDRKMSDLFSKIQTPLLTDLRIEWPAGVKTEMWPQRLPDLYAGDPIIISARVSDLQGNIKISGKRLQQPWNISIPLANHAQSQGVGVLWAREKIASLMDKLAEGISKDVVKMGVVDVALDHHLVSKYTSLVAVDVTPSRPPQQDLKTKALKTNMPAGWKLGQQAQPLPQTATNSLWDLLLGLMLIILGCSMSLYFQRKKDHAA